MISTPNIDRLIDDKTALLRKLAEGETLGHVRGLLELLDLSYKEQLADVAAEDLARVQGALKQVQAMHNAIFGSIEGQVPRL